MDTLDTGGDSSGLDAHQPTAKFQMVSAIAEALRAEFGVTIDAHPGGEGGEAGVVNRAFRATVRVILAGAVSPMDDFATVQSRALRRAALLRLTEFGMDGGRAEHLLDMEPGLGPRRAAAHRPGTTAS